MTEKKRYTLKEYDKYQYIAFDEDKPMMAIKLKAFGTYACFHQIIDKMNEQDQRIIELEGMLNTYDKGCKEIYEDKRRLEAQLYCTAEGGVCEICKHMYLEENNDDVVLGKYYISRCEKGHDECSKDILKHCIDFELKRRIT